MRLFFGVLLSVAMRREWEDILRRMARDFPEFKWTSPENLHFTLKFLGEVSPARLPEIQDTVSRCVAPWKSFNLSLGDIGYFPNGKNPQIIWRGVNEGRRELADLAKNVADVCCGLGFPRENRPFQPHLTIARARPGDSCSDRCPTIDHTFRATTQVNSFSLIESCLTPQGPVYHSLTVFSSA